MRFGANQKDSKDDIPTLDMGPNKFREEFQKFFSKTDDKQKIKFTVLSVICFLFVAYIAGFITLFQDKGISALSLPFWHYYLASLISIRGWLYLALSGGILAIVFYFIFRSNGELDSTKISDERGVNYSEKGTYGTAEWMSKEKAKSVYEVTHIDNAKGIVLAQYTEKGKEAICLPVDYSLSGNRNIMILGSAGTGKSFCYVRNAIFQSIVRGESVVITDPKGELYESTSEMLRQKGYKVYVYNLVNPRRSDAWNCMSEIYDMESGDVSDIRVTEFADTLMKNTTDGPDDHFWGTGESNLLKAIIMFCSWRRELALKSLYEHEGKSLLKQAGHIFNINDSKKLMEVLSTESSHTSMKEREQALRIIIKLVKGKNDVNKYMEEIKREAPPCDMASMYYMLVTDDIKALEEKFKAVPISHPAGISWCIFKNGSDNVRPGIVQGLAQRLQLFQMRDIRRITTNDDICFEDLGAEKIALFCIISDKSTAMRALTSLFFTFLFKDVSDAADRIGVENRIAVNVICDEFANIGTIPSFDTTISTVRSRKINISIILQSIMQLDKNYDKLAPTIISCCDTVLFLGCNDKETSEHISDLTGIASIRVLSTKDDRSTSLGNRGMMQGYSISEGDGKRNVMNPDEVRRLTENEVLIYHNGCFILKANRCGYIEHKFMKENNPARAMLRDYPLASEKYELTEGLDSFLQGDVSNMTRRNQEIITNNALEESINKAISKKVTSDKGTKTQLTQLNSDVGAFEF